MQQYHSAGAFKGMMSIRMEPIGFVRTDTKRPTRHWSVSDVEGTVTVDEKYVEGVKDIKPGQRIVVIFHFHRSPAFSEQHLRLTPPHRNKELGVFSTCSPLRPNPVGMSILEVLGVEGPVIRVKGLDMLDGTPVLDIKPHVESRETCPSFEGERSPTTS
jgi:tRNA-Thr(GGU) m(6)t(6)A37 methyltransferase TsaA